MSHDYKVLIVEDDFRIGQINREFVEKVDGFQVIGLAKTGEEALRLQQENKPDLVLLDVYIPDVSGLDLFWSIRERNREAEVIMITASREIDTVKETLRGGVFDYLIKPIDFYRLQASLERYKNKQKLLADKKEVGQEDIDVLLRNVTSSTISRPPKTTLPKTTLPKGVDPLTLRKVSEVLEKTNGVTAVEVGLRIGVSRTTARRYLEYLVQLQTAKAELIYGEVGRPERRYFLL